jgi:hypothetical protein
MLSGGAVVENAPNGRWVATVTGLDPDAGTTLSYSLTDNAGGRFAIDASSGAITVANGALLDYEDARSHHVAVRIADQYGLTLDTNWTLAITNVNEKPTDATLSGGAVAENAPFGTAVATVRGIDPDAGTVFDYSLVDSADGRFDIDAATGVVSVANGALLDYETATSHQIKVRSTDQGGLSFEKSWTINVTNVPEAPTDAKLFGGTVREHAANGTHVGTLIGTDQDAGSILSYSLTSDAGGRFDINASTGVVTVKDGTRLDYATAQSYSIGVCVTDQTGLSFQNALTVTIAAGPVNNPDGTSTVTIYDGADAYGWASFKSSYNGPDGHGSLLSQLGSNDNGSTWQNVFDVAHAYSWDHTTSTFDPAGHLLTRTVTNDDGTHALIVNDPANTASWSTYTMNFDAGWNYVSVSDVVMDPGQTFDMGAVWSAYDTLTWYANPYAVGPAPSFVVSDFNGDGKSDLLLLNNSTRGFYVCEMNGAQIGVNAQSGILTSGWHYSGLGDFDGDRKSDVVLLNDTTHGVYVCEMDGTEIRSHTLVATVPADLGWYYKGLGDFNNDGKSDIIQFNDITHGVYICEMDGLTMGPNALVGTIDAAAGWAYKTLGDFNGDGKADFLFLNDQTHGVKVWQMDGTELVADQAVDFIDAAQGWRFKDTADFNGDGKTDLLLLNDANNHVMIWQMNGTPTPTEVDLGAAPDHFHFADKGDFNGDGKTDLMFINDTNGDVKVWQMNGTVIDQTAKVGTIASGYHYTGTGEFNADGKTDLIFQNDATRAVQLWQMNGTEILVNSQMALLTDGWHMVL